MSLSSRSMYVSLHQRIWAARSADRSLAAGVENQTHAQNRTMKVLKQLAPSEYLLPIKRVAILGQDQHAKLTLPGMQKGQQLLATKLFDEYTMVQADIRDAFYLEVDRFSGIYPDIIEKAPRRLGKAFRASDFPLPHNIKSYFDYTIRFAPVPDAGNWLLDDIDVEDIDKLRNEIENQKNEMFRDATKELFDRTVKVLENLASQAKGYVEGQPNGAMLRDVTINSVKELAGLISSMNLTGDPTLNVAAKEMQEKFADLDAKELRNNAATRSSIQAAAERLIAKMRAE